MSRAVSAYGVVILPPPAVRREVEALRRKLPVPAPPLPVHITVKAPFLYRGTGAWVVDILEAVCARFEPFTLELRGLGSFGTEVIYIQVEESEPLRALHQTLITELTGYVETLTDRYEGYTFLPHLTLVDKLVPEEYYRARQALNGSFFPRLRLPVSQLHLLRGQGRSNIARTILLGSGDLP